MNRAITIKNINKEFFERIPSKRNKNPNSTPKSLADEFKRFGEYKLGEINNGLVVKYETVDNSRKCMESMIGKKIGLGDILQLHYGDDREETQAARVTKFTMATGEVMPSKPHVIPDERVKWIAKMVISELMEMSTTINTTHTPKEFIEECLNGSDPPKKKFSDYNGDSEVIMSEQADALVDIGYYINNFAAQHGFNLDPYFDVVHEANLKKRWSDGTFHRRETDNKVIKPPNWEEPDVVSVVKKQRLHGSWTFLE